MEKKRFVISALLSQGRNETNVICNNNTTANVVAVSQIGDKLTLTRESIRPFCRINACFLPSFSGKLMMAAAAAASTAKQPNV